MAIRMWTTLGVLALALGLPQSGQAQIVRNVAGGTQTVRCGGQTVEINGAGGTLTLLGQCPRVQVNGTSITVKVEVAGSIDVDGMGNTVIWERAVTGSRPRISSDGIGNSIRQGPVGTAGEGSEVTTSGGGVSLTVGSGNDSVTVGSRRGGEGGAVSVRSGGDSVTVAGGSEGGSISVGRSPAPKARGAAIVVSDNRVARTVDCAGGSVTVDGNGNTLSLNGECPSVEVNGNGNVLRVEAAGSISVMGNRNTVTWSRGIGGSSPQVSNLGTGNSVTPMGE